MGLGGHRRGGAALDEIYAAYEARFADFEPELIAPADGSARPCGRRAWWR